MHPLDQLHGTLVHGRRVSRLQQLISAMIPAGTSRVLDVGCGDGLLSSLIQRARPDLTLEGIDVLVRSHTRIPVVAFDGQTIPHPDRSFDFVLFVDVLHHTEDPGILLREAARVTRRGVILKDHRLEGVLAGPTLRFMDWVGNARHGVVLPYNYQSDARWRVLFNDAGLRKVEECTRLGLYPAVADWWFGRGLHLLVRLERQDPA